MSELYLITGGGGFIGSHVAEALAKKKKKVRVVDNFSTGSMKNLKGFLDDVEVLEGDVRHSHTIEDALKNVSHVVHLAALGSVPRSVEAPINSHAHNVDGTLALLDAVRKHPVKRFVYASSSAIYGENPSLPRKEDDVPMPVSPYAVTKIADEDLARIFHRSGNVPTVGLRFFNVFGPRQDPDSPYAAVIPRFLRAVVSNEPFPIYGDGHSQRDYTYVADVVQAILSALQKKEAVGQQINVAGGKATTTLELARLVAKVAGQKCQVKYMPPRPGDAPKSYASVKVAEKLLGYKPQTALEEGLKKTLAWFREHHES
jgi:nucleoside-diphosphate-sugar epimerase